MRCMHGNIGLCFVFVNMVYKAETFRLNYYFSLLLLVWNLGFGFGFMIWIFNFGFMVWLAYPKRFDLKLVPKFWILNLDFKMLIPIINVVIQI